jgi:tripartite-type tricarboxylate transporter receptor subunit TctC
MGRSAAKSALSRALVISFFLVTATLSQKVFPQDKYPDRPITLVVSVGAGGTQDVMMRTLCKIAEPELGQTIIVENRAGAAGIVGIQYVLSSKPDGYTIGAASHGTLLTDHYQKLPFSLTDINPILPIYKSTSGLVVKADAPWNTYEELLAYAKKNPGKFTYAMSGVGGNTHIVMERIARQEGIKWTAIPFKSDSEVVIAVLGGNTLGGATSPLVAASHIEAEKLKVLLVLTDRWTEFPKIPTMLEKGYNFYGISHNFIFGQKDMPDIIRKRLEQVFLRARENKNFIEAARKYHMNISTDINSGKELADFIRKNHGEMAEVIKTLGISDK